MISKRTTYRIYDAIQKAWVVTCIGVSVGGLGYIGYQMFHYFTKIKPIKKELEEQFKEELLREGRMLREQKASQ